MKKRQGNIKMAQKKQTKKPKNIVEELKDDLGHSIALQTLHDSEGGQLLIENLVTDILGSLESLMINVDNFTHLQLVAILCKMKERSDLLKVLTGAKARVDVYQDLLSEELKKEEESPTPEEKCANCGQ